MILVGLKAGSGGIVEIFGSSTGAAESGGEHPKALDDDPFIGVRISGFNVEKGEGEWLLTMVEGIIAVVVGLGGLVAGTFNIAADRGGFLATPRFLR